MIALTAGMLAAGGPAEAGRRLPVAQDNTQEWKLINLTSDVLAQANKGRGVIVGLYDGLTDCGDADFGARCSNFRLPGARYTHFDAHGTHTAGIVAGGTYGVAPFARVINYGVFDDRGFAAGGSALTNAWYDSARKGASIASMSFGCTGLALCFSPAEVAAMADPNLKLLFVKAAGNDGVPLASESVPVSQAQAEAALSKLVIVGSVELSGKISSYSNTPGTGCLLYSGATGCETQTLWANHFMVAPGSYIYSTLPGNAFGLMSGTSMATPVVAGAAALLEARWPQLKATPDVVASILLTTAKDLGAPGVDPVYGWGLLDVGKAFQANGTVNVAALNGQMTPVASGTMTVGRSTAGLAKVLASTVVYDRFGRDFTLAESGRLNVAVAPAVAHQLLGRDLAGMGSQQDWANAFFASKYQARGFVNFASPAEPAYGIATQDRSMRMGVDMPFKGGVAQLRLTGATGSRLDFAYDPSLAPLSFFSSTDLMTSSLFMHALFNVSSNSRLSVYGTTSSSGSMTPALPDEPFYLRNDDRRSSAAMALRGTRMDHSQKGVGIGYWMQPDSKTVIGLNASMLSQKGGYYNLSSDLAMFDKPTRMVNLGAAASRRMGSWELSASGEMTHLNLAQATDYLRITPATLASAELRLRKNGVALGNSRMHDSLSLAFVMPPRAVSGSVQLGYLTPTADGLGRKAFDGRYSLSELGNEPMKVEAAYRLSDSKSWSVDLTGGMNMEKSYYGGAGELLATAKFAF